jgi:PAS domain S-box-containing protein
MDTISSLFGRNIAQRRVWLSITREELASRAGISLSMLAKIERDEVNPTIAIAGKLARALNTTISALLEESPEPLHYFGNVRQYIDSLRTADEQFEIALGHRQEIDSDFHVTYSRAYIFDRDCRYLFASAAGARLIGMLPRDMVGKHWRELGLPVVIMEHIERNVRAVFSSGKTLVADTIFPTLDGLGYFEYRLKPLFDEGGDISAVIATVRNITDTRLAELELMNSLGGIGRWINEDGLDLSVNSLNYLAIYANSLDAILLTAPDGRILDANPAACRMFGMSREELVKTGRGVADPTDPRLQLALAEREETGAVVAAIRFIRKDGSKFVGEVSSSLFHTSTGQVYTSMIIRDITHRACRGDYGPGPQPDD